MIATLAVPANYPALISVVSICEASDQREHTFPGVFGKFQVTQDIDGHILLLKHQKGVCGSRDAEGTADLASPVGRGVGIHADDGVLELCEDNHVTESARVLRYFRRNRVRYRTLEHFGC